MQAVAAERGLKAKIRALFAGRDRQRLGEPPRAALGAARQRQGHSRPPTRWRAKPRRLRPSPKKAASGGLGFELKTVLHIGIGGSDLGPRLIWDALRDYASNGPQIRFVANVDPEDFAEADRRARPKDHARPRRLQILQDARDGVQRAAGARVAGEGAGRGRKPTTTSPPSRPRPTRRRRGALPKTASSRWMRPSAAVTRSGPRSACRCRSRSAPMSGRASSRAPPRWTRTSATRRSSRTRPRASP